MEQHSLPLLDYIDWKVTEENNVNVLNDTKEFIFQANRKRNQKN